MLGRPSRIAMNSVAKVVMLNAPPRVSSLLTSNSSLHSRSAECRVEGFEEVNSALSRLKRPASPEDMPPKLRNPLPNIAAAVASSRCIPDSLANWASREAIPPGPPIFIPDRNGLDLAWSMASSSSSSSSSWFSSSSSSSFISMSSSKSSSVPSPSAPDPLPSPGQSPPIELSMRVREATSQLFDERSDMTNSPLSPFLDLSSEPLAPALFLPLALRH